MLQADQVQDGCVDVVNVHLWAPRIAVRRRRCRADHLCTFHAASRQPHGEAMWVVVAAMGSLTHRRAADSPPESPRRFEISSESGNRLVALQTELTVIRFQMGMTVPAVRVAAIELDEADSAFDHSPSKQTTQSRTRTFPCDPIVKRLLLGLLRNVHDLGACFCIRKASS